MISRFSISCELLAKSIRKISNIVVALQRKSEATKSDYNFESQKSLKGYVSNFSVTIFESLPKKY